MATKKTVELFDYNRIGAALGVPASKLRVWHQRGKLPEPDFRLGQSPGWLAENIEPWIQLQKKGRETATVPAGSPSA